MAQTPLQPNYMKVFIQRDYSEGEKRGEFIRKLKCFIIVQKMKMKKKLRRGF